MTESGVDPDTVDFGELSDVDLLALARLRRGAFSELWSRHRDAGLRAAAKITNRYDPQDLVQEAFARILNALSVGSGPRASFLPYLYATIRNVSMNWSRQAECASLDDLAPIADPDSTFDEGVLDRAVISRAFASLHPRWRDILWYTEVEGLSPREAGRCLGLSANAASVLAHRARARLRTAWIQAHVPSDADDPTCRWARQRMGAYKCGALRPTTLDRLEQHLVMCASCSDVAEELDGIACGWPQRRPGRTGRPAVAELVAKPPDRAHDDACEPLTPPRTAAA